MHKGPKAAAHHWWPRCVSKYWVGRDGLVGRISPDGSHKRIAHHKLGVLKDGHTVRLSKRSGEPTPWDHIFESEFDKADTAFPWTIEWLAELRRQRQLFDPKPGPYTAAAADDDQLRALTECVVSLAVRSPRNREMCVSAAEHVRGPVHGLERNALAAMNIRGSQRAISERFGHRAKVAALFAVGGEFIFGDGFFVNFSSISVAASSPRILIPLTPTICVVISRPNQLRVEPRFCTRVLSEDEVDICNDAVQIYSKNEIFYRNQQPQIIDEFAGAEHRQYGHPDNPIDELIRAIPGIPPRDRSMDGFFSSRARLR